MARIAAIVTFLVVSVLAAIVAAGYWQPILALIAGIIIGLAAAFVVALAVLAWPVVRVIWWWSAEITLAVGLLGCWQLLASHATLPWRLAVMTVVAGVPAAIPQVRRQVAAVAYCVIVRHRIRACFAEFIITNRSGSLPLIFAAIPTPAGARVTIWLRPGLSLGDLQQRLDKVAVACWASSATAEAASESNAARVRLDIRRGNTLRATITSPLAGIVPEGMPAAVRDDRPAPTALDLPDITAADVTATRPARAAARQPAASPAPNVAVTGESAGSDISDWI